MGDRAGSIPVIRTDKKARHLCVSFFYGANVPLEPVGSMSPLRSGRRRANVHRTLCALSSAVKSPVFLNSATFVLLVAFDVNNKSDSSTREELIELV